MNEFLPTLALGCNHSKHTRTFAVEADSTIKRIRARYFRSGAFKLFGVAHTGFVGEMLTILFGVGAHDIISLLQVFFVVACSFWWEWRFDLLEWRT